MGRGVQRTGCVRGGILDLVRLLRDHDRAIEYDLMTRTGRTLDEMMSMGAAGMVALVSFINHLPPDSALNRSINPKDDVGEWYTTMKTNVILADMFDAFVTSRTKKGRKPKAYPRPKNRRGIGKGAIPIKDFWNWWNKKE